MTSNPCMNAALALCFAAISAPEVARAGVGYLQEWASDPSTADAVVIDVFIPLDEGTGEALPSAEFSYFVPAPNAPGGLVDISALLNFRVTGEHLAIAAGTTVVRAVDDPGQHIGRHGRAVVLFPGSNAPVFPLHVTATGLAEAGYVVFAATLPGISPTEPMQLCARQQLASAVLNFIEGHEVYGEIADIFGMGHSIGGYMLIAMMSEAQHCIGLERDARLRAAALLDATWSATTAAQLAEFEADALSFCQACAYQQMALQIESGIARIDLEGFITNPLTGEGLPFGQMNAINHVTLFTQNCLIGEAIRIAGGPPLGPFEALCQFPETLQLESRSLDAIIEHTESYFNHVTRGRPRDWPPGGQPDEPYVHVIDEIPVQPTDGLSGYCFAPGTLVVDFAADDLPERR